MTFFSNSPLKNSIITSYSSKVTRKCDGESWSGTLPECEAIDCGDIDVQAPMIADYIDTLYGYEVSTFLMYVVLVVNDSILLAHRALCEPHQVIIMIHFGPMLLACLARNSLPKFLSVSVIA